MRSRSTNGAPKLLALQYESISNCLDNERDVHKLLQLYIYEKLKNEMYARYILSTRRQKPEETLSSKTEVFKRGLQLQGSQC